MNVKELIEKIEGLNKVYGEKFYVSLDDVLDLVKQLDEPQPVKVQQCVADWYEENKDDFEISLFRCIYEILQKRNDNELNEFENWVIDENTEPFKTLVNMHQFGYEVEKEKRYLVKVKGVCGNHETLNCEKHSNEWLFSSSEENRTYKTKFTRKELEGAGFGWVFDCPGIEIEEVK